LRGESNRSQFEAHILAYQAPSTLLNRIVPQNIELNTVTFSYRVEGQCILRCERLSLLPGKVSEVSGVENDRLRLFGGVLTKVLPSSRIDFREPHLQSLMADYSGTLDIEQGVLPVSGIYVGPDPEQHLFFTYVYEELQCRLPKRSYPFDVLGLFRLDDRILNRRCFSLSGGEKMKLALAIAFATPAACYVFHGALAWLDKNGRTLFRHHMESKKHDGAAILFIETSGHLNGVSDFQFWFDGVKISAEKTNIPPVVGKGCPVLSFTGDAEELVSMSQVAFSAYDGTAILKEVTCQMDRAAIFGLVGENGAGKSTLAKLILRLVLPNGGVITLMRQPLQDLSRPYIRDHVTYLAQFPESQVTLSNIDQYRKQFRKTQNTLALSLMGRWLELGGTHPVSQLSALQFKLLVLISGITQDSRLLILDEPTWGLDGAGVDLLLKFLAEVVDELRVGLLLISHDLPLLRMLDSKIWWLRDGMVESFSGVDALLRHPLAHLHFDLANDQ